MKKEIYIGTYNVVKKFRISGKRKVIERGLTEPQAQRLVSLHPDSDNHIVIYSKQYSASKYFINQ
tara:strand:- start:41 stop:235 length:195 start_codon:yes stop_codon:yes gene_type:complete